MIGRSMLPAMTGVQAGIERAQQAADHADRVTPKWSETALKSFVSACSWLSTGFSAEDVRDHIIGVPTPPDNRAWGAVVNAAVRRGCIEKTGAYTTDKHGSPKPLYRFVKHLN